MTTATLHPLPARPLLLAAAAGLVVTLRAPLGTTVIGLILFGVLHNLFELRYLAARFVLGRLSSRLAWLLAAPIIAVVAVRAVGALGLVPVLTARHAEIALVYGSLGLAALVTQAPKPLRGAMFLIVVVAGVVSWSWVYTHYLVLTHLHNLMPVVFLVLHRPDNRRAIVGACLLWAVAIPAALLLGGLDPMLDFSAAFAAGPVDPPVAERLRGGWATAGASIEQATRIAATFSFLQWMHYFIWIFYLPRHHGTPPQAKERRLWGLFFGPIGFGVALIGTVALAPVYISDYLTGFQLYGTLAAFHALVEFPILLAVLLSSQAEARPDELVLPDNAAV